MINPLDTTTKTGMVVRGVEIISNVGAFALALKNSAKLSDVKTNTEDIKALSRQNISRVADINDTLRYYFPKPQQPQPQPVMAPAPQAVPPAVPPVFTQPVVAPQPQPVVPAVHVATPVQQPVIVAAPPANTTAEPVAAPVQAQVAPTQPAPQPAAAPVVPAAEQKQG